jgi:hypothetical protein
MVQVDDGPAAPLAVRQALAVLDGKELSDAEASGYFLLIEVSERRMMPARRFNRTDPTMIVRLQRRSLTSESAAAAARSGGQASTSSGQQGPDRVRTMGSQAVDLSIGDNAGSPRKWSHAAWRAYPPWGGDELPPNFKWWGSKKARHSHRLAVFHEGCWLLMPVHDVKHHHW